jgi:MFS family permease
MTDRTTPRRPRAPLYHGWLVVGAAFLVAMYGFGLGFYGVGVYLVALNQLRGWSVAELSSAITVYYVLGAMLLFCFVSSMFERYGARKIVLLGTGALACGAMLLPLATRLWHVYVAFAVMSVGWATMSGAAINIIVAPWFQRRRGVALSWAMNGASAGGVVIAPLLTWLTAEFDFAVAINISVASMIAVLLPVAFGLLHAKNADERDPVDDAGSASGQSTVVGPAEAVAPLRLVTVMRSSRFITVSVPFALALTAQVGFLTHQVAFLSPTIGTVGAGWAVSLTTFAAVLGRILTGYIADRFDRRAVACGNFIVQTLGLGILMAGVSSAALYLGCVLFGLGVGNTTSLPGLLVQQEFPKQHFARLVGVVVAINQFSFAFGPGLLGQLERLEGTYLPGLFVCILMEMLAAIIVVTPVALRRLRSVAQLTSTTTRHHNGPRIGARSSLRRPAAERQTAGARPLPNTPSTASTPPPKGERCYPCVRYDLSPMSRAAQRTFDQPSKHRIALRGLPLSASALRAFRARADFCYWLPTEESRCPPGRSIPWCASDA